MQTARFLIKPCKPSQSNQLAQLRVEAMKESLMAVNRFDPERAKTRFLNDFDPKNCFVIYQAFSKESNQDNEQATNLIGFYVLENHLETKQPLHKQQCYYLAHFYIHPNFQGNGTGSQVLDTIKQEANGQPIRLGALVNSRSNDFYQKQGFKKTHSEPLDCYYIFNCT